MNPADIIPDSAATPPVRDRFGMPAEGFAKLSLETADPERLCRALKGKGVECLVDTTTSERKSGQSGFMIKDPDGNLIQVFGRSPKRR